MTRRHGRTNPKARRDSVRANDHSGVPQDIGWEEVNLPGQPTVWRVSLGPVPIGEVHRISQHSYAGISHAHTDELAGPRSVHGFHTRHDAVQYILLVSGYRKDLLDE
jgi:hypothetical protein